MTFNKELEKKRNRIFKKVEEKIAVPLPPETRKIIGEAVGDYSDYDGDPDGEKDYLDILRIQALNYGWAGYFMLRKMNRPKSDNNKPSKPRKVYRGTLERRVRLIDFVIQRKGGISARSNWKQLTAEWNKEYTHNQKNLNVLKADYHRAFKDDNVGQQWIAWRVAPAMISELKKFKEKMGKIDWAIFEKHGFKDLNDLVRLEDMGVTIDNLLIAQDEGRLDEYIKNIIEKRGYKERENNERTYRKEG